MGIEISEACYDCLQFSNFVTHSLRFPIRFNRPDLTPIFSSFVYIDGGIWSDETDWNRNLGRDLSCDFVTISLRFYSFVTISLRSSIRFIRPSFAPVFSSFVYIEGEIWSDETDRNRNLCLLRFVTIRYDSLRFSNLVTIPVSIAMRCCCCWHKHRKSEVEMTEILRIGSTSDISLWEQKVIDLGCSYVPKHAYPFTWYISIHAIACSCFLLLMCWCLLVPARIVHHALFGRKLPSNLWLLFRVIPTRNKTHFNSMTDQSKHDHS